MKIVNFKNEPIVSPFAPEWSWFIAETKLEGIDWSKIAKIILEKEKEIIEKYPASAKGSVDGYTGLGEHSLTSRYEHFNVLEWDYPQIKDVFNAIKKTHREFISHFEIKPHKVWIQCWANVMRDGQSISPHLHSTQKYSYLGGQITVQCNDVDRTSTVYVNPINQMNEPQEYYSENETGKLTIFQNNIPHYTTKHTGQKERISIAFDIIIDADPTKLKKTLLLDE
jgi:hypothetical protein